MSRILGTVHVGGREVATLHEGSILTLRTPNFSDETQGACSFNDRGDGGPTKDTLFEWYRDGNRQYTFEFVPSTQQGATASDREVDPTLSIDKTTVDIPCTDSVVRVAGIDDPVAATSGGEWSSRSNHVQMDTFDAIYIRRNWEALDAN